MIRLGPQTTFLRKTTLAARIVRTDEANRTDIKVGRDTYMLIVFALSHAWGHPVLYEQLLNDLAMGEFATLT